jgi:NitT/TauT family transport system substrate-binding protein
MGLRQFLPALLMGLAVLSPCGFARADEPLKLRVAWTEIPTHLLPVAFAKPDILKHYGKSYTVDAIRFRGSAPEIEGLASGELDIATLGYSSFGLAILNARMDDLRVIADGHKDGVAGYQSSPYVVLASSPIRTIDDLKGKIVATNAIGGAAYFAMVRALHDHGLEDKRDYHLVEIGFPNMLASLQDKKIDLGTLSQPSIGAAERDGGYRNIFTIRDAMHGETQMTVMSARAPFIAAHRAALVDFYEDFQTAIRWFTTPSHRDEAIKIISDFTKQPVGNFSDWLFTKDDSNHDPDVRPNLVALQSNIDAVTQLGFLKAAVDVKSHSDLSLIDEAAKRHPFTEK